MPRAVDLGPHPGTPKRGPGRPPKVLPVSSSLSSSSTILPPQSTIPLAPPLPPRAAHEESRKKITSCSSGPRTGQGRALPKRGRGRPPRIPTELDSGSEDDIPSSFSDVVKIIIQKVQETQTEINSIEESYNNYKNANEESTALAMKFYAAVPKLHERVAAGSAFDDDLIESVFAELFPTKSTAKNGRPKTSLESSNSPSTATPSSKSATTLHSRNNSKKSAASSKRALPETTDDSDVDMLSKSVRKSTRTNSH